MKFTTPTREVSLGCGVTVTVGPRKWYGTAADDAESAPVGRADAPLKRSFRRINQKAAAAMRRRRAAGPARRLGTREDAHEEAPHQLRRPGDHQGRRHAGGARPLPPRGH